MVFLALSLIFGPPLLLAGWAIGSHLYNKKKMKPWREAYNTLLHTRSWAPIYSFGDGYTNISDARKTYEQDVMTMPQLTFERWKTFYDNKPECWVIQRDETRSWCNIPYYVKENVHKGPDGQEITNVTFLPTFWANPEDLKMYRDWVEEQYEHGNAKVFENERNAKLKQLSEFVRADLDERCEVYRKEIEEQRVLTLKQSDGTEVTIPYSEMR